MHRLGKQKMLLKRSSQEFSKNTFNEQNFLEQRNSFVSDSQQKLDNFKGPSLEISSNYVSFVGVEGIVSSNQLVLKNNGSTAVYYEWVKMPGQKHFNSACLDTKQRFFCHHKKNVILPEQQLCFVFSFYSTMPGTFSEDWELKCEPKLKQPIPIIHFTGHALVDDGLKSKMGKVFGNFANEEKEKMAQEILNDILDEVRTQPPPPPDLNDPEVAKVIFEELNRPQEVYYSTSVIKFFYWLYEDLNEARIQYGYQPIEFWDHSLHTLDSMIQELPAEDRNPYLRRMEVFLRLAQWKPFERSAMYDRIKHVLTSIIEEIPPHSDTVRKDNDVWEYNFRVPGQLPEEEENKFIAEDKKIKETWVKKKKRFTEEDEKELLIEYIDKFNARMWVVFFNAFSGIDQLSPWFNLNEYLKDYKPMQQEYFEHLIRKYPLKSTDIDSKRVVMRYHIKYAEGIEGLFKKEAFEAYLDREETRRVELAKFQAMREHSKKPMTKKEKREEIRLMEPEKPELSFIDSQNYNDFIETLRYCIEGLAKLVILVVSFDKPYGGNNQRQELFFLFEHLKQVLDCPVNYLQTFEIDDRLEAFESEIFPEGSVLLLENIFLEPGEVGFYNDDNKNQQNVPFYYKEEISKLLKDYGQVYLMTDRESLFFPYTSTRMLKNEMICLTDPIYQEVSILAHTIITPKSCFTVIFGGPLSTLSLSCLVNLTSICDKIILMGEIGLALILIKHNIPQFQKFSFLKQHRQVIEKVLGQLKSPINRAQIVFPTGIVFREKILHEDEDENDQLRRTLKRRLSQQGAQMQDYKEIDIQFDKYDPNLISSKAELYDYSTSYYKKIYEYLKETDKLLIIENPLISISFSSKYGGPVNARTFNPIWMMPPELLKEREKQKNQQTQNVGKVQEKTNYDYLKSMSIPKYEYQVSQNFIILLRNLNERQQVKKLQIKQDFQKSDPFHDFENDLIITVLGSDIETIIKDIDFQEVSLQNSQDQIEKIDVSQEHELQESIESKSNKSLKEDLVEDEENLIPKKKIFQLADFYIKSPEFVMRLLSGERAFGLESVGEYPMMIPEDDNDFKYIKLI